MKTKSPFRKVNERLYVGDGLSFEKRIAQSIYETMRICPECIPYKIVKGKPWFHVDINLEEMERALNDYQIKLLGE